MTITEFLSARLDEDEAAEWKRIDAEVANLRTDGLPDTTRADLLTMRESDHWRRPLADIAVRRAILALHKPLDNPHIVSTAARCAECGGNDVRPNAVGILEDHPWAMPWPCPTLRLLAQPFADHKDYDPAWRVA